MNNLTRIGIGIALVGGAANSMLYNGKRYINLEIIKESKIIEGYNLIKKSTEVTEPSSSTVSRVSSQTWSAKALTSWSHGSIDRLSSTSERDRVQCRCRPVAKTCRPSTSRWELFTDLKRTFCPRSSRISASTTRSEFFPPSSTRS